MGHSTPSLTLPPRGGGNFTPSPAAAGEGGGGGRRTAVMLSAAKHQNGPAMPSAAKHPWLPRSFGLRPQDDKGGGHLDCRLSLATRTSSRDGARVVARPRSVSAPASVAASRTAQQCASLLKKTKTSEPSSHSSAMR